MEFVDPIKDIEAINKLKKLLKKKSKRNYLLFVLGINTGIRINDLIQLKVEDVWTGEKVRELLIITDNKHYKGRPFYLNSQVQHALNSYFLEANLKDTDFLFSSKKSSLPISRQQAYRIINHAAKEVGIPGKIGTHTIRKTFGYHAYTKGIAISILQTIFGHTSSTETLKYLGIDKRDSHVIKVDVNL